MRGPRPDPILQGSPPSCLHRRVRPISEPSDPLRTFLHLYGRGEFWASHEVLEGPWRETGSTFYHGLILYASAWVHRERGNAHGVRAQLGKALNRLADEPAMKSGVDVEAIRRHCEEVRIALARPESGWEERIAPLELGVLLIDPHR